MNALFHVRRRIAAAGLVPRTILARITLYLWAVVLGLLAASALCGALGGVRLGASLGSWGRGLSFPATLL
ncbi:MAG TPA: hypothetical protein VE998_07845, partial [Terriglobales bacterium]|nr:hypothetical protein [Terriglobales bacterium]